jgi:hypothetical protein
VDTIQGGTLFKEIRYITGPSLGTILKIGAI